ncbi:NUDIX hydrolase [Kitasatospora sp. NBC_00240]|uniref:NUDIX hydrolase n=1 Tax=Kitasatospora sp. NBC_00240 TaxID=2903567 RepID=UPI00224E98BD|nr:NUDIX hydrolase [Kitasatospora sp. NBC_00240]MCX5214444.1 NUDIX hydrolase [Kitasatospora sp. NBC_00240]
MVSASLLLADPRGRVLMLHQAHPYPRHPTWWQPPGGLADPGERPYKTALRELAEEPDSSRPGSCACSPATTAVPPAAGRR